MLGRVVEALIKIRLRKLSMAKVHLLDYVAGNIRSLVNAIEKCGYEVDWIRSPEDVQHAEVRGFSSLAFPLFSVAYYVTQ